MPDRIEEAAYSLRDLWNQYPEAYRALEPQVPSRQELAAVLRYCRDRERFRDPDFEDRIRDFEARIRQDRLERFKADHPILAKLNSIGEAIDKFANRYFKQITGAGTMIAAAIFLPTCYFWSILSILVGLVALRVIKKN